jgi:hypothetical protein
MSTKPTPPLLDRRALLASGAALPLTAAAASAAPTPRKGPGKPERGKASEAPRAIWPPKAKHPLTTPTQFVLLDKVVRFLPHSPKENPGPGMSFKAPAASYPDNEVNHPNDGFSIVWIDKGIVPKDLPDSWYSPHLSIPPDVPQSWKAPVNFFGGKIYYRVDVMEKPDDKTLTSLLSRICTENHEGTHNVWLGHGVVTFDKAGLHHFEQPVMAFRPFVRYTRFSWEKPVAELQLIVADSRGAVVHKWVEQPHNAFEGSPNLGLYLPLKVRYTAVVVAEGEQLEAPAWWG